MGVMILGILGTIILSLFVRLLGVEIGMRHKPICRWLVKVAAAHLPDGERTAAESEWLAVIEDLRSPTAQLLHSASYVWSALRIRREIAPEIAPETPISPLAGPVIVIQLLAGGMPAGVISDLLIEHRDDLVGIVREHVSVSKPIAIAMAVALALLCAVLSYVNHRILMWYFGRQAQRRANTPIE
jgi:hypothetical protein